MFRSLLAPMFRAAFTVVEILALLLVELIAAMLIYSYLNLNHIELFGHLVRNARYVLDVLVSQMEYWLPGSANDAYASLVGELGPKSLLLLLIGLVSAMVIRFIARSLSRFILQLTSPKPVAGSTKIGSSL
jgi:predicted tellurium resistance membrane protein TerC